MESISSAGEAETTNQFQQKTWQIIRHGALSISIAIGSRLGLFDFLVAAEAPLTSQEIAQAMHFKERYVREWLGAMACGGIVEVKEGRFWIPPHRHAVLSGPNPMNTVGFSWAIGMLGQVTDDLMECFKLDGPLGVPYSKFPLFHQWREERMPAENSIDYSLSKIKEIPGLLDKLECGMEMCELGCSTGHICFQLAERFPKSTIYGMDISQEAIGYAKDKAARLGVANVKFLVQDCCDMPQEWTGKWEYIFANDLVHDVPKTTSVLREIKRILKPGCVASIVDINVHSSIEENVGNPEASLVYTFSLFHCMTVSLALNGEGLGSAWGKELAVDMMKQAGFTSVETHEEGIMVHYMCS